MYESYQKNQYHNKLFQEYVVCLFTVSICFHFSHLLIQKEAEPCPASVWFYSLPFQQYVQSLHLSILAASSISSRRWKRSDVNFSWRRISSTISA